MSKVVHPFAHRLVILRDWKSRWFAKDNKYKDFLRTDVLLREFLEKRLRGSYVSSIEVERSQKTMRVIIRTSRPGMIIGRSGEAMTKLKNDITKELRRLKIKMPEELKIDVSEIASPEADAGIVAYMVAEGLEKRLPYRRVLKQTLEKVMQTRGVKGARTIEGKELEGPKDIGKPCPKCAFDKKGGLKKETKSGGGKLVIREGRFGSFISCSRYPKCKYIEEDPEEKKKKDSGVLCPVCKSANMSERRGRFGIFYSCGNYPDCKNAIKAKPTGNICHMCGSLMMEGTKTIPERCSNKQCQNHNPHKIKA
jgi:ribosomal protein S3